MIAHPIPPETIRHIRTEICGLTVKAATAMIHKGRNIWGRYESGKTPMPKDAMELFLLKARLACVSPDGTVVYAPEIRGLLCGSGPAPGCPSLQEPLDIQESY